MTISRTMKNFHVLVLICSLLPFLCFAESEQSAMEMCDSEAQSQGLSGALRKKYMQDCMPVERKGGSAKVQQSNTAETHKNLRDVGVQGSDAPLSISTEVQWWGPEGSTALTINGQTFAYSSVLGVIRTGNTVCAINYMSFLGEETAHVFHGEFTSGRTELVNSRRLRGRMNESPRMELYVGVTKIVQRIYVGGDDEPRLFLLPRVNISLENPKTVELKKECFK